MAPAEKAFESSIKRPEVLVIVEYCRCDPCVRDVVATETMSGTERLKDGPLRPEWQDHDVGQREQFLQEFKCFGDGGRFLEYSWVRNDSQEATSDHGENGDARLPESTIHRVVQPRVSRLVMWMTTSSRRHQDVDVGGHSSSLSMRSRRAL